MPEFPIPTGRNACATFLRQECLSSLFPQAGMPVLLSYGNHWQSLLSISWRFAMGCKKKGLIILEKKGSQMFF